MSPVERYLRSYLNRPAADEEQSTATTGRPRTTFDQRLRRRWVPNFLIEMEPPFSIGSFPSDCCRVIKPAGTLDLTVAPMFEEVLDQMMPPDHLIVDLSELGFTDSTGLRLLHRASTLVSGRIWLKGCSPHVRRLLDISGLSDAFCLEEDPDLAHSLISVGQTR